MPKPRSNSSDSEPNPEPEPVEIPEGVNKPFFFRSSEREAVLFLHGLGGGPYEFRLLADRVHRVGWTTRAIVYPGHDSKLFVMPDSNWRQWVDAARTAFDELKAEFPIVHAVGFSTGSPIALKLADERPDVASLTLLSPFLTIYRPPLLPVPPEKLAQTLGKVIPQVPRRALTVNDPSVRKQLRRAVRLPRTFNMSVTRSALELIAEVRTILPQIKMPLLIMQSQADTVVDPEGAREIYQNAASKKKRLVLLKRSDHLIPWDLERETVYRETLEFLGDVS